MLVVEPGCGMGFFTLELARMVGPAGKVVAVDLQPRMLSGLARRARRAGLADRIEMRRASGDRLGLADLDAKADLAVAIHVVHEVPDPPAFFAEIARALKPGGCLLVVEPKHHVSVEELDGELRAAAAAGLAVIARPAAGGDPAALLVRTVDGT
jgi:ubiquinone/menaquinone biosynthesis C-methylase UbiE